LAKIIEGEAKRGRTAEEEETLKTLKLERKKLQNRFVII